MGLFGKSKTPGEKAREITLAEVGQKEILFQVAGNNRYLVITSDTLFIGSLGIASGSFAGQKVKRYPIDLLVSVDVRKSALVTELEISIPGSHGMNKVNASFTDRTKNEDVIMFPLNKYAEVQKIAAYIFDLRQWLKNKNSQTQVVSASIPEQIKQLADLRDSRIITNEDFEAKKRDLLSRM